MSENTKQSIELEKLQATVRDRAAYKKASEDLFNALEATEAEKDAAYNIIANDTAMAVLCLRMNWATRRIWLG